MSSGLGGESLDHPILECFEVVPFGSDFHFLGLWVDDRLPLVSHADRQGFHFAKIVFDRQVNSHRVKQRAALDCFLVLALLKPVCVLGPQIVVFDECLY